MDTIEKLERRIRNPWPLRGRERRIYAAVAVVLALGTLVAISTGQWHWFARFGSVVVVVGIYFTWLDLSSVVSHLKSSEQIQLEQLLKQYEAPAPGGLLSRAQHEGQVRELKEQSNKLDRLLGALGKRIKAVEAGIIALGTVVWGFGDALALCVSA